MAIGGYDVLAKATDYFHLWQLPLLGILLFGWIVGGGYLFQRAAAPYATNRRQKSFSRGILVSFLSGMVGLIVAGIFYKIGSLMVQENLNIPVSITGIAMAIVGFLAMSFLVIYAMHKLTFGKTFGVWLLPIGGICVLGLAVLASCTIPAYYIRQANIRRDRAIAQGLDNLMRIRKALTLRSATGLPDNLQVLVDKKLLRPEDLKNPADPDREIGFFYMPRRLRSGKDEDLDELLVVSYAVPDMGRLVLYTHPQANHLGEESFKSLLDRPENKAFAEALQKTADK